MAVGSCSESARQENFPAGPKAGADWFPKRERTLAIGCVQWGQPREAILRPSWFGDHPSIGWRMASAHQRVQSDLATEGGGSAIRVRNSPSGKGRGRAELAYSRSRRGNFPWPAIPWRAMLTIRRKWAICARAPGEIHDRPHLVAVLFWLPDFLGRGGTAWISPLSVTPDRVYIMSGSRQRSRRVGLIARDERGRAFNRARKLATVGFVRSRISRSCYASTAIAVDRV